MTVMWKKIGGTTVKQGNLKRLNDLQPEEKSSGLWLVEDCVAGADQVKASNCILEIDGMYPRSEALVMTKGQICLWLGLYDGHRDEEERKTPPVKKPAFECGMKIGEKDKKEKIRRLH